MIKRNRQGWWKHYSKKCI